MKSNIEKIVFQAIKENRVLRPEERKAYEAALIDLMAKDQMARIAA